MAPAPDAHSSKITELQVRQAVHQEMLASHSAQIAQISREASERHGQLISMHTEVSGKMDTIIAEHNQNKGAEKFKLWLIPLLLTAVALSVSLKLIG